MADFSDGKLNEIVNSGYNFKGSEYISRAYDIFKQAPGSFIGYILLAGVVSGVISSIPLSIFSSFASTVIGAIMYVGIYIVAHKIDTNQPFEFGDFFIGFKKNTGQIAVVSILLFVAMVVCFLPMAIFGGISIFALSTLSTNLPAITPIIGLGMMVGSITIIFVYISLFFSYQFVVFHDMQAWPAIQASMKLVSGHRLQIFWFFILLIGLNFLGILALFIGLLVTIPITYIAGYTSFADVTKLNEASGMDIMDHLIDDDKM